MDSNSDPFHDTSCNDLFSDTFQASVPTTAPLTTVNSRPLAGTPFIAPFVPCSVETAISAIRFANVSEGDILLDMGCGDGRILIEATKIKTPPRQVIGVELDDKLCEYLKNLTANYPTMKIVNSDMFKVNIAELKATVMILYLLPEGLEKLKPMLKEWLENTRGGRIVTITYSIPDWECTRGKQCEKWFLFYYE